MANGFGGGFGGNMGGFSLPDFSQLDLSGIGASIAKYEAEEAKKGATNQYEADVADFKTNEAKELEKGLGSLPEAMSDRDFLSPLNRNSAPLLSPDIIEQLPQLPPEILQQVVSQLPLEMLPVAQEAVQLEQFTPVFQEPGVDNVYLEAFNYDRRTGDDRINEDERRIAIEDYIDDYGPVNPPVILPEDPIVTPPEDPIVTPPEYGINPPEDPIITPPPEEYVPKEPMYTPREVIQNPSQGNLIGRQRKAYNSNLSNLVYRAPDVVREEYVRPMSAAQFGSAPGSAEDVRTPVYKPKENKPPQVVAMNQGGSLNLNSNSLNKGIGQLPPMQQQDKLTQLFQSSFRPRR